ncbi:SPla/RYanodine receptor SPRY [Penicillium crustosum]|uniref:SPla/RYanodine receptor SPRY n=1 Tax=Penicillium crustosum TaxID=36656 RepID=UPI00239CE500|nr:SPla/RYanodine receptor SPRY [Penicillium crustosum]KAJ5401382.1 SPla/RYanodine receptor SPRY [Penicillium crustosum]
MANAYYHALTVPLNLNKSNEINEIRKCGPPKSQKRTNRNAENGGLDFVASFGGRPANIMADAPFPHPVELELQPRTPTSPPSHAVPPTPQ